MLLGVIGVQDYMLLPLFFCLVDNQNAEDMDGYVGFLAAVRRSYYKFVEDLSKQCKQTVQHHLDSVTSPYYHFPGVTFLDLSDSGSAPDLPGDLTGGKKKGNGNLIDGGQRKSTRICLHMLTLTVIIIAMPSLVPMIWVQSPGHRTPAYARYLLNILLKCEKS
jgi:hypothetical protein